MARFRLLTPDAQYADAGTIERQTAGTDVERDIRRARTLADMPRKDSACESADITFAADSITSSRFSANACETPISTRRMPGRP